MPTPTPSPQPTPVTPPAINWQSLLIVALTALSSFLSGLHIAPNPNPSPTPNGGGQVQPSPQPQPSPAPVPVPPSPQPSPALITVVGENGNTVSGNVDSGKMITVTAATGLELTPDVPPGSDVGVSVVSPVKLNAVLRSGTLQIVVTGPSIKPTICRINCNQAPQPPPNPQPNPQPKPAPIPDDPPIISGKLSIAIVEDPAIRTNVTAESMNNVAAWNGLQAKGHKVRVYAPSTSEINGIAAINAQKISGVPMPAVVLSNLQTGSVVKVIPLPSADAIQSTIAQYGG